MTIFEWISLNGYSMIVSNDLVGFNGWKLGWNVDLT